MMDSQSTHSERKQLGAQLGVVKWHENKHQGVVYEKHSVSLYDQNRQPGGGETKKQEE